LLIRCRPWRRDAAGAGHADFAPSADAAPGRPDVDMGVKLGAVPRAIMLYVDEALRLHLAL